MIIGQSQIPAKPQGRSPGQCFGTFAGIDKFCRQQNVRRMYPTPTLMLNWDTKLPAKSLHQRLHVLQNSLHYRANNNLVVPHYWSFCNTMHACRGPPSKMPDGVYTYVYVAASALAQSHGRNGRNSTNMRPPTLQKPYQEWMLGVGSELACRACCRRHLL